MAVVQSIPAEFHSLPYDQQLMLMLVPKPVLTQVSDKLRNDPNYDLDDAYAEYGSQIDEAISQYKPQGQEEGQSGTDATMGALGAIASAVAARKAGEYVVGQVGSAISGSGTLAAPATPNILSAQAVSSGAGTAGAGTTAGSTTTGTTAGSGSAAGGSAFGGMGAAGAAGIAAGLYAGYQGYKNYNRLKDEGIGFGDMTDEEVDSVFHPDAYGIEDYLPGNETAQKLSIGHVLTRALFGSGKHEDQIIRDRIRDKLEERDVLSKNDKGSHVITLADGSTFDVGRDGQSSFTGMDGQEVKYGYEADWSNPLTETAAGVLNPLFQMIAPGENDRAFRNQLVNAAVSNASSKEDVLANAKHFYKLMGVDSRQQGYEVLEGMKNDKRYDIQKDLPAYQYAFNMIFDDDVAQPKAATPAPQPQPTPPPEPVGAPPMSPKTNMAAMPRGGMPQDISALPGNRLPELPNSASPVAMEQVQQAMGPVQMPEQKPMMPTGSFAQFAARQQAMNPNPGVGLPPHVQQMQQERMAAQEQDPRYSQLAWALHGRK